MMIDTMVRKNRAGWCALRRVFSDVLLAITGLIVTGRRGRNWRIESLMREPCGPAKGRGLVITLHPERLVSEAYRLPIFYRLIMPLITRDGVCLNATWASPLIPDSTLLPVRLVVDRHASHQPVVELRIGTVEFNRMVLGEQAQDKVEASRNAGFFGQFQLGYQYRIDSLQFSSEPCSGMRVQGAMNHRTLRLLATGCVRARVGDGILCARTTCKVKRLLAVCHLSIEQRPAGLCLRYRVDVQKLKLSARNIAPWLERRLGRQLRDLLQEAMNRRAAQWGQRGYLLPAWLPLDTDLKLDLLG